MKKIIGAALLAISLFAFIACEVPTEYIVTSTTNANDTNQAKNLATPSNLQLTVNYASSTINFTWDPVPGAEWYDLYRSSNDGITKARIASSITVEHYTDDFSTTSEFFVKGKKYHYYVMAKRSYNADNGNPTLIDSALAGPVIIDTAEYAIPASTIIATDGTYSNKIVLTWTQVKDPTTCLPVTTYEVYKAPRFCSAANEAFSALSVTNAKLTEEKTYILDDLAVTAGIDEIKYYTYYVVAVAGSRRSVMSALDTGYATQNDTTPYLRINAPANVYNSTAAAPHASTILIEWDEVVETDVTASNEKYLAADSYDVYVSTKDATTGFEFVTNIPATPANLSLSYNNRYRYNDTRTKEQGLTYNYKIVARNSTNNMSSALSSNVTGLIRGLPQTTVTMGTRDSQLNAKITWSSVTNNSGYRMYFISQADYNAIATIDLDNFATVNASATLIPISTTIAKGTISYYTSVAGLTAGTIYRVLLVADAANSQYSMNYSLEFTR